MKKPNTDLLSLRRTLQSTAPAFSPLTQKSCSFYFSCPHSLRTPPALCSCSLSRPHPASAASGHPSNCQWCSKWEAWTVPNGEKTHVPVGSARWKVLCFYNSSAHAGLAPLLLLPLPPPGVPLSFCDTLPTRGVLGKVRRTPSGSRGSFSLVRVLVYVPDNLGCILNCAGRDLSLTNM